MQAFLAMRQPARTDDAIKPGDFAPIAAPDIHAAALNFMAALPDLTGGPFTIWIAKDTPENKHANGIPIAVDVVTIGRTRPPGPEDRR